MDEGRVMRVMRTTIYGNLYDHSRKSAASRLGKQLLHKENNRGKHWKEYKGFLTLQLNYLISSVR